MIADQRYEVSASEARRRLPELCERVREGRRFLITRYGKPVAALVPLSDVPALQPELDLPQEES